MSGQAYVQKIRLFAAEDDDDRLYQRALEVTTEDEARTLLENWCTENEVPVPFLQARERDSDRNRDRDRDKDKDRDRDKPKESCSKRVCEIERQTPRQADRKAFSTNRQRNRQAEAQRRRGKGE